MRHKLILCLTLVALGICTGDPACVRPAFAQSPDTGRTKVESLEDLGPPPPMSFVKGVEPDVADILRVDTNLVACDVLVQDKDGRVIRGLGREDFIVTEDDRPQEIATFGMGDDVRRPRSIVLIIDYSGSMLPYMNTSIEAAKSLVDKLNPDDRMAIVTDDVETLVDFTKDRNKLKSKLESLRKKAMSGGRFGSSEQYSALMDALKRLIKKEELRPIIIFQTDGDELTSLKESDALPSPAWRADLQPRVLKEFSLADVFTSAQKSRVTLYSVIPAAKFIGLSPDERREKARGIMEKTFSTLAEIRPKAAERIRSLTEKEFTPEKLEKTAETALWMQTALTKVAEATGGWADFLESPDQAAPVYSRIFADINDRYIIGYQPTNKARDGKLRKIRIAVRGRPDYVVRGRDYYYAPAK